MVIYRFDRTGTRHPAIIYIIILRYCNLFRVRKNTNFSMSLNPIIVRKYILYSYKGLRRRRCAAFPLREIEYFFFFGNFSVCPEGRKFDNNGRGRYSDKGRQKTSEILVYACTVHYGKQHGSPNVSRSHLSLLDSRASVRKSRFRLFDPLIGFRKRKRKYEPKIRRIFYSRSDFDVNI